MFQEEVQMKWMPLLRRRWISALHWQGCGSAACRAGGSESTEVWGAAAASRGHGSPARTPMPHAEGRSMENTLYKQRTTNGGQQKAWGWAPSGCKCLTKSSCWKFPSSQKLIPETSPV